MHLQGQVAIITGAASGIGYGIACAFAREGSKVVVADRDLELSGTAATEISRTTQGEAFGIPVDVTDETSVEAGVKSVIEKFGGVDILVSNAGIQLISSLDKLSYSGWKSVIGVHLDGAFLTTRACLRHMYASGKGGSIIYIGSVHSKTASILKGPYVAAKHGLLGLCRVVAKEGAQYGVRSNVICPGFVRTPLVNEQIPEQARMINIPESAVVQAMLASTIDQEFTTIDEVADAVLFVASRKTLALTGQSMIVSHGWVME